MINPVQKQVLQLAVKAGEIMMQSGAEIYRVEDTISRICAACRIPNVEVFATPTGVFVSIDPGDEDSDVLTYISRIHSSAVNLNKISDINEFSRVFTTTDLSIEDGLKELDTIAKQKRYPVPVRLLGAGLVSAFFCALLSGSLVDSLCSGLIGVCSFALSIFLYKYDINYFIRGFCCCALATVLALLSVSLSIGSSAGSMVIGSLMLFVPGAAITNAIRDFLYGDMLSGVARMTEALVIAVSLATGAGIVIKLWSISGMTTQTASETGNMAVALLMGLAATFGFCIILHAPAKNMLVASIIGGVGWGVYQLCNDYGSIVACFLGACAVGLLSDISSRVFKQASTVFTIPGIMPLVPGAGMYYTMLELINGNLEKAAITGAETIFLAWATAIGLLTIGSSIKIFLAIRRKILRVTK
ncbi:MAG: threonine/serine exporter family protein [Eubacteriaceae bacterium]|nr:threonine/serine exporter family protein [Eubacteriaceae bacterium]